MRREEVARDIPSTRNGPSHSLSPGNHREFCLAMSTGHVGKCGDVRKGGALTASQVSLDFGWQAAEFFKGLFQRVPSEITFDGSVMGRLEGLQDQNRVFFPSFTEI